MREVCDSAQILYNIALATVTWRDWNNHIEVSCLVDCAKVRSKILKSSRCCPGRLFPVSKQADPSKQMMK